MNFVRRFWKYLLSFLRSTWVADDYPQRWRRQSVDPIRRGREVLYPKPLIVQIPGWWTMTGAGHTREEALGELQAALDAYQEANGNLPRPGTAVAIRFAPFEALSGYEDIARDFFPPILGMSYDDCFITDSSSLWDFPLDESDQQVMNKVLLVFGVDISDIADGNLAKIFARIKVHRRGG